MVHLGDAQGYNHVRLLSELKIYHVTLIPGTLCLFKIYHYHTTVNITISFSINKHSKLLYIRIVFQLVRKTEIVILLKNLECSKQTMGFMVHTSKILNGITTDK